MLIVLFIIFIVLAILSLAASIKDIDIDFIIAAFGLNFIAALITIVAIIFNAVQVSSLITIDKKIEMYKEENNNIQNSITTIVQNYMNYESNTYIESLKEIDTSNLDIMIATQIYPDLKANELVNKQIEIYQNNNDKIKQLKEQKFDGEVAKWWLYFGKTKENK